MEDEHRARIIPCRTLPVIPKMGTGSIMMVSTEGVPQGNDAVKTVYEYIVLLYCGS